MHPSNWSCNNIVLTSKAVWLYQLGVRNACFWSYSNFFQEKWSWLPCNINIIIKWNRRTNWIYVLATLYSHLISTCTSYTYIHSTRLIDQGCIHLLNTCKYCGNTCKYCGNTYKYWGNTWKMCSPASVILASIVTKLVSFEAILKRFTVRISFKS